TSAGVHHAGGRDRHVGESGIRGDRAYPGSAAVGRAIDPIVGGRIHLVLHQVRRIGPHVDHKVEIVGGLRRSRGGGGKQGPVLSAVGGFEDAVSAVERSPARVVGGRAPNLAGTGVP